MSHTPDHFRGKAVLMLAHVIGMVDMVALPVWIGTLVQHYRYDPAQAGITVTLFLLGVVVSSSLFAPRFDRLPHRLAAAGGFAVAAFAFFIASRQPVDVGAFGMLAVLHALAGAGVGCALTVTHGSIGRSGNPHRLFAVANTALGFFAVVFLGGMPQLLQRAPASSFFLVVALSMGLAAVVAAMAFPVLPKPLRGAGAPAVSSAGRREAGRASTVFGVGSNLAARVPRAGWFVIATVVCLTLNQSMVFAFLERIGAERGFGADRLNGVLIALGLVNLLPGALAAMLQKRLSPVAVGIAGPIGQALLALTLSGAAAFAPYAVAASFYVFMVIFTHSFLFGLLSRLDPSGRAAAATPAMMMLGACTGPVLGGLIVQGFGYPALGVAACGVAALGVGSMLQVRRHLKAPLGFQAATA